MVGQTYRVSGDTDMQSVWWDRRTQCLVGQTECLVRQTYRVFGETDTQSVW